MRDVFIDSGKNVSFKMSTLNKNVFEECNTNLKMSY